MNILITGATGFLGSHLAKDLLNRGHEVCILKRSFSDVGRLRPVLSRIRSYNIDQCGLDEPFHRHGRIDAVIHTATCYGRSNESVSTMQETNIAFPLRLLETAANFHVNVFLNTDTLLDAKVNYYALSKSQFTEWGRRLADDRKIHFINFKFEHIYGEDDDESKFVTYVVSKCLKNVPTLDLTRGEQKRDFIYVGDIVRLYALAIEKSDEINQYFTSYNVGTGTPVSIRDFVTMIHQTANSRTKLNFGAVPYRNHEMMEVNIDTAPLEKLGWKSEVSHLLGIRKTIGQFIANEKT